MMPSLALTALPKVPFRGLKPFRYADRSIFFVRETETRMLLRLITVYRGVLFYGDSGTGKSSLINAGLVPQAMGCGLTPERIRVQPRFGEEFVIERLLESDEEANRFLPSLLVNDESSSRVVLSADEFMSRVRRIPADRTLLLMMDQFEEWVTLVDQNLQAMALADAHKAQERVLDVLVKLLRDHSIPVKVLFVFREDYLAKLNRLFRQCPDLVENYLRLTSPATVSLQGIIRGPFDVSRPEYWKIEIPDQVAKAIQQEIEQRGHNSINLSEVQVVCLRLWESGQPEKVYATKKIGGILEDFLEKSLAGLGTMQEAAIALLSRMVTSSGTRNVVSQDDLIERVKKEQGISRPMIEKALNALVDETKLVNRELRNDTYFYEIVSEFLVPWIFQQKQKLATRAARTRLIRRVASTVLLMLVLAILAAVWYRQENTAVARESQIIRELEASKQELNKLVEAKTKEALVQELLDQKRQAEARRDQAVADLSAAQTNLNFSNSKSNALQQENGQLATRIGQLQQDLQQEQGKRKQAEDARQTAENERKSAEEKIAALQARLEKGGDQPQEPTNISNSKPNFFYSVVPKSLAHQAFGESASKKYTFIQLSVQNPSEFDIKITRFTVIVGNLRFSVQQDGFRYGLEIEKNDRLFWLPPAAVSAKSSKVGVIVIPATDQDKKVSIAYEIEKVLGTSEITALPK